jgi:hypothetical protein
MGCRDASGRSGAASWWRYNRVQVRAISNETGPVLTEWCSAAKGELEGLNFEGYSEGWDAINKEFLMFCQKITRELSND